jgi:hypothetical protein
MRKTMSSTDTDTDGVGDGISLRAYVDMRFEMQDKAVASALAAAEKAVSAALAAADRAVSKAEGATERRFDSVNEFRGALNDSARLMMPRGESEQFFRVLADKIDALDKRVSSKEDRGTGMNQGWLILVSIVSTLSTIIMVVFYLTRAHTP